MTTPKTKCSKSLLYDAVCFWANQNAAYPSAVHASLLRMAVAQYYSATGDFPPPVQLLFIRH